MKRFGWILVVLMAVSPAWAAKKVTVQQLKDLLSQLQTQKKDDTAVAAELKQIELSEQLTRATMNSLTNFVPGALSTEQIYVLEAKSAILPPPASDLPTKDAPPADLLTKAQEYATKTYGALPHLTSIKTTARFQDRMEAVAASSGMSGSAKEMAGSGLGVTPDKFVRYISASEAQVESQGGAEILPKTKDKTPWGANGMVTMQNQPPVLSNVVSEAQAAGHIAFLRWETVNGKAAAVYAYSVDKKKSKYNVQYCCFPDTESTGTARFSNSMMSGGGAATASGNMQTNTQWHDWKSQVPYHGEFFVDPDTAIVVRLIVQADFKNSDIVHLEDQRFDYGPVTVDGKTLIVPLRSVVSTEVVVNGENSAGGYKTRHTMLTTEFKDYAPAK